MATLAKPHQKRLQILHKLSHVKQGESGTLHFCRLNADNEVKSVYQLTTNWRKTQLRAELGGFVDVIELAETAEINAQIAAGVHAVANGSTLYKVQVRNSPSGFTRYWELTVLATEPTVPGMFS